MFNLKQTLLMDAASAFAFVILCLGANATLVEMSGLPPTVIAVAGWICLLSALLFAHQAFAPSRALLAIVVLGNIGWVIASLAVWATNAASLTLFGHVFLPLQAVIVAGFAILEWRGLRALSALRTMPGL